MATKKGMFEAEMKRMMESAQEVCWKPECDGEIVLYPKPIPKVETEDLGYGIIKKTRFLVFAECNKCSDVFKLENEFGRWQNIRTSRLLQNIEDKKGILKRKRLELQEMKRAVQKARAEVKQAVQERIGWNKTPSK